VPLLTELLLSRNPSISVISAVSHINDKRESEIEYEREDETRIAENMAEYVEMINKVMAELIA
jgi:hypothetical protein